VVNQNNLMTPPQLEDLSNRPALLAALYDICIDGPPAPSIQQLINSLLVYIQNGWMTPEQVVDVLVNIRVKGPEMRKLMALTTTLNLAQGQFQWLFQNPTVTNWLTDNPQHAEETLSFATSKNFDAEATTAIKFITDLASLGQLPVQANSPSFHQAFNQYPELSENISADPGIYWAMAFAVERARLKWEHPTWSDWHVNISAAWNVSKKGVHVTLDGIGLVPGIGEIADLTNAGIYFVFDGDYVSGTLSVASAVPISGWFSTGAKYATKTLDGGVGILWHVDDFGKISFGSRGGLARVLKTAGTGKQAHHIIPWEKLDHDVIQTAAKKDGTNPFHMNDASNGMALGPVQHQGSHPAYTDAVLNRLDKIKEQFPNITPEIAAQKVLFLTNKIRDVVNQHSDKKVNDPIIVELIKQIQF
jgi:hypothetical protein